MSTKTGLTAVVCLAVILTYTDATAKSKKKPKAPPPAATAALEAPAAVIAPPLQLPVQMHYTLEIVENIQGLAGANRHGELAGTMGTNIKYRGAFVNQQDQISQFDCLQFDRPDETNTTPQGLNNDGTIFGNCDSGTFGFVRRKSGQLYQFSPPGADNTFATGMNDWEEIVGEYTTPFTPTMTSGWYRFKSFLRLTDGSYQIIAAPKHSDDVGAPNSLTRTFVTAVNNRRHIIGTASTIFTPSNEGGQSSSFLYSNGQFTALPKDTVPIAINNDDQILLQTTVDGRVGFAIYDDGHVFAIANPVGYVWSSIRSLNDVGQLTGRVREDKPFPFKTFQVIATPIQ